MAVKSRDGFEGWNLSQGGKFAEVDAAAAWGEERVVQVRETSHVWMEVFNQSRLLARTIFLSLNSDE